MLFLELRLGCENVDSLSKVLDDLWRINLAPKRIKWFGIMLLMSYISTLIITPNIKNIYEGFVSRLKYIADWLGRIVGFIFQVHHFVCCYISFYDFDISILDGTLYEQ